MEEKVIVQEKIVVPKPRKSPFLAGLLSALFPFGIGPFYNGEVIKGFIYLVVFAGLITMQEQGEAQPFVALILAGFYFFQIIDSVHTASRINRRALLGKEIEEGEEDLAAEAIKAGSVFWGILLIVLGAVLLLGNFEVISYKVIFDLWPAVVIVIGAKLVLDYFSKDRS